MAIELPVRPLTTWPGPQTPQVHRRSGGQMSRVTPGAALSRLKTELDRMRARDCCIQIDVRDALRRARASTHPDLQGGDRARWDEVESAAKVLGVAS